MKTKTSVWVMVLTLIYLTGFMGHRACEAADLSPEINAKGYIHNDLLVSAEWVKANLENKNILLMDARGEKAYDQGHIPGAVPVDWKIFSDMKSARGKGFAVLLGVDELTGQFQAHGIKDGKTIVVYADPNGWGEDGRIVWMLRMAGLSNTKILDGGWPGWKNKGGAVTKTKTTPEPSTFKISTFDTDMLATTNWMRAEFDTIKIVDTRTKKEFDGATDYKEPRGGHITGAIHIPWTDFLNADSTVKSQSEIEAILAKAGIKKQDTVVTYCTSGIRSAHAALVLRMAGYHAKNYDASINEWGAIDDLPMEK